MPDTDRLAGAADHYREQGALVDAAVADVIVVLEETCGDESRALLQVEDAMKEQFPDLNIDPDAMRSLLSTVLVRLAARQREDARRLRT